MQIVLIGNYGVGNAGDECLSSYFERAYPEYIWVRLSADRQKHSYPFLPTGIRSLIGTPWFRTLRLMWQCDAVLFGGGTLFTDQESVAACFIWYIHAAVAHILRKPVLFAFQGIGPFHTRTGRFFARHAFRKAFYCSVRDIPSLQRYQSLLKGKLWKKSTECIQSFDPSILYLQSKIHDIRTNNLYIFIPRFSPRWTPAVLRALAMVLAGKDVCILSLCPKDRREQHLCRELASVLHASLLSTASLPEAASLCFSAHLVLSQRYHGCLAALSAGAPFCAITGAADDKLAALAKECGCASISLSSLPDCADSGALESPPGSALLQEKRSVLIERALLGEHSLRETLRSLTCRTKPLRSPAASA